MTSARARDWWWLAAICVLAAALRIYRIDASLWYDEVLTLTDFVRLPVAEIVSTYGSLNNHVFFSLQAHAAIAVLGESAWALRLPAVFFGLLTVPLLWLLVRQIGAPIAWAHVSTLLLALNYHHIWFSQNARGYTGLVFWCLVATVFLVSGWRTNRPASWIGLVIAGALAMYTHLSAAFFLAALFITYLGVALRRQSGNAASGTVAGVAAFAGIGILAAALHAPMIPEMIETFSSVAEPEAVLGSGTEEPMARWKNPLQVLMAILRDLPVPMPVALVFIPVLGLVLLLGLLRVIRLSPIVGWAVPLSVLVTVAILLVAGMRIWPRYFLVDLVLMLLVATAGVAAVGALFGGRWRPALTATGWTGGILVSAIWAGQNYVSPKQDLEGAVARVEAAAGPDDIKASFGLAARPISTYFAPGWTVIDSAAHLALLESEGRRVWLVYAFADHSRTKYPELFEVIERRFAVVDRLAGTLGGGLVYVLSNHELQSIDNARAGRREMK